MVTIHIGGYMKKVILLSTLLISFSALGEETVTPPPQEANPGAVAPRQEVVNQRQENQEKRIEQGVKSGALTDGETRRMERRQDQIQKMEDRAMKDGKMTGKEFRRIEHRQNQASRQIHRAKHNRRGK